MNRLRYIWVFVTVACAWCVCSCDVHEFPYPVDKEMTFTLNLDYNTEMPFHKLVEYYETKSNGNASDFYVRYIVDATPVSTEGEYKRFVFTNNDINNLNNSLELDIVQGEYRFAVWTDFIPYGTDDDHFYNTERFEDICINGDEHIGSNDFKDAFNGSCVSEVSKENYQATVCMKRPLAKFNFISSDVNEFISKVASLRETKGDADLIDIDEFTIVFAYQGFVPSSFNMHTNKPADSRTNVMFRSKINLLNSTEAELGFDYVFVHEHESFINVAIGVYDKDGKLISQFKPVEVPLMRSKLTTVKANFLTSNAGSGVAILPDFDGEYNVEIK